MGFQGGIVLNDFGLFHARTMASSSASSTERVSLVVLWLPIFLWAFAFPFIKIGLTELSPINLTILRLSTTCLCFLVILAVARKKFSPVHKSDILPLFLLGFSGLVVYHLGLNYGETLMSPSAASLIIATIPLFMVLLAAVFLKERITKRILAGICVSAAGVIVIALVGTEGDPFTIAYLSAAVAVFIAAIVGAIYTIAGKKMLERFNGLSLTVYAFLFGSLGLIPLALISPSLPAQTMAMTSTGWGAVLFLAIFPTVIGYVLWYVALEKTTASKIGIYLYFIPIISTVISYFMFDETITLLFVLGAALVIGGLFIMNRPETT
jgi:drug/metabolite transporter (DMT)-like permease